MLSIPKHGWVSIEIGDWSDRASYLTDVPCDLLDALISIIKGWTPTCIKCDAEGWDYVIIFDSYNTHIIEYGDKIEYFSFEISAKEIANEVYDDISEHLHEWSLWDYCTEDEDERAEYENKIKEKLDVLGKLLYKTQN